MSILIKPTIIGAIDEQKLVPTVGKKPVILVVDDDTMIRTILKRLLESHGMEVILAANGDEALKRFRERYSDMALVLMDVKMPGMDGPDVLSELRRLNPHVRCCFMSGDLGEHTTEKLQQAGALHLFQKPFVLDDLLGTIRELTVSQK